MLNNLGDKADHGRDQPTIFTFPAMTKSIYTRSVRTVKARIKPRQPGICITSKKIYDEGTPSRICCTKVTIFGNTPVVKINDLTVIISFLIKRTGNGIHSTDNLIPWEEVKQKISLAIAFKCGLLLPESEKTLRLYYQYKD